MSTALAIAATSRVICAVIDDAISTATAGLPGVLGQATTTSSPPDHIDTGADNEVTHLNLFLYHVTYNQGWRQVGLPTRNGDGAVIGGAPLGLDLHYLLSAYGAGDFEPQMLLGIGMQALQETPVLYRSRISDLFKTPHSDVDKALATAGLAQQLEMIKITPQQLGTEELAKLWTAFPSKFRVSAGYAVTVVLIESTAQVQSALPVLSANLTVVPFLDPTIDAIDPATAQFAPGLTITISGDNLPGKNTVVLFDSNPGAPQTLTLINSGAKATVNVPAVPAGINTLRVVRQIDFGTPPLRNLIESNVGSFVLRPVLQSVTVGPPDNSVTPPNVPVTLKVAPALASTQQLTLLLNQFNPAPGATPLSFSFDGDQNSITASDTAVIKTHGVPSGQYLVRLRIDGAESPLTTAPTPPNAFNGPLATF